MLGTFNRSRNIGIGLAALLWLLTILLVVSDRQGNDLWTLGALAWLALYGGILFITRWLDTFSSSRFGLLPAAWMKVFAACPFAALPVFILWEPEPPYTPPAPDECVVCGGRLEQGIFMRVYTSHFSRRYLGTRHQGFMKQHQFQLSHRGIQPHNILVCEACLQRSRRARTQRKILLAAAALIVPLAVIQNTALLRGLGLALCLAVALAGVYTFGRWGDVNRKIEKQAIWMRTGGSPNYDLTVFSESEYRRLVRDGEPLPTENDPDA